MILIRTHLLKRIITFGIFLTLIILISGCNKREASTSPPPYYPSLAVVKSDSMEIYQLYTSQFSSLSLPQKMLCYHAYRACVIGQNLIYDQDIEEFSLSSSTPDSSLEVLGILRKMISELELAIEFTEGESKEAIWAFIRFLQSGDAEELNNYYYQLSLTFTSDIIVCFDFFDQEQKTFSFNHVRESFTPIVFHEGKIIEYGKPMLRGKFGGAILILDILAESRINFISNLYNKLDIDIPNGEKTDYETRKLRAWEITHPLRPYELICATGTYSSMFNPIYFKRHSKLSFDSKLQSDILITNLTAIGFQESILQELPNSLDSIRYETLLTSYGLYKQVELMSRLTPLGIRGSGITENTSLRLLAKLLPIWCLSQEEIVDFDLVSENTELSSIYDAYLLGAMQNIFRELPRDYGKIWLGVTMSRYSLYTSELLCTFLIHENCIELSDSTVMGHFNLVNVNKMETSIEKLIKKLVIEYKANKKPRKPKANDPPSPRSDWKDEMSSLSRKIFTYDMKVAGLKQRQLNYSTIHKFILPEPKLIRNKMGGITDVEMIHTLDFNGQMQKFAAMSTDTP